MKTLTALLVLLSTSALADQRTIYDRNGKAVAREAIDSQGTRSTYGADGRTLTRESNGVVYDARTGRVIAKEPRK